MSAKEWWYQPAECGSACDDEDCPYTHRGSWRVAGSDRNFETEEAAMAYAMRDECPECGRDRNEGLCRDCDREQQEELANDQKADR